MQDFIIIDVSFLVAPSATVGHARLEHPVLKAWMDTYLFEILGIIWIFCFWLD